MLVMLGVLISIHYGSQHDAVYSSLYTVARSTDLYTLWKSWCYTDYGSLWKSTWCCNARSTDLYTLWKSTWCCNARSTDLYIHYGSQHVNMVL